MNTRTITGLTTVVMVVLAVLMTAPAAVADNGASDQPQNTEDVLHLTDGRVLRGEILEETESSVRFEYVNRDTGIRGVQTISKSQIIEIEHDVPIDRSSEDEDADRGGKPTSGAKEAEDSASTELRRFGVRRGNTDDERVPSFYIVPVKGQMGTDIRSSLYKKVAEDIKRVEPDVIVLKFNSQDVDKSDLDRALKDFQLDPNEISMPDFDDFRVILDIFHDQLGQYEQVVWVEDAMGLGAMLALGWDEIYMKPGGRLGGLQLVTLLTGAQSWSDTDVRAKMTAAVTGYAKAMMDYGGYSHKLADAMMLPKFRLSASFKGREVNWHHHTEGEFLVDGSDEATASFDAKVAEDLLISHGTADSLEDLALLMGYREFRVTNSEGKKIVNKYIENWRRELDRSTKLLIDFQQYLGWANGNNVLRWLGKAKQTLEKVVRIMEMYPAVEDRFARLGLSKMALEIRIEQLQEQIRQMGRGGRGGGGGGTGGGLGGGGG